MLMLHTHVHRCQNTSLLFPTAPLTWHKHQFLLMMPRTLVNSQLHPGLQVPCNAGFQPVSELLLRTNLITNNLVRHVILAINSMTYKSLPPTDTCASRNQPRQAFTFVPLMSSPLTKIGHTSSQVLQEERPFQ